MNPLHNINTTQQKKANIEINGKRHQHTRVGKTLGLASKNDENLANIYSTMSDPSTFKEQKRKLGDNDNTVEQKPGKKSRKDTRSKKDAEVSGEGTQAQGGPLADASHEQADIGSAQTTGRQTLESIAENPYVADDKRSGLQSSNGMENIDPSLLSPEVDSAASHHGAAMDDGSVPVLKFESA